MQCTNNLKQLGLAMHNYESVAGAFPITGVIDTRPTAYAAWVGWSGHARILPLMEQGPMFNSINFTLKYTTADNYTVAATTVSSFICPSETDSTPTPASTNFNTPKAVSNYGLNMGDWFVFNPAGPITRGVFSPNISRRFANFTDGTSNTVLASEVKIRNPEYNCIPGLSLINNPLSVPDPTANPYVVAPEYSGSCGAVGQGHTAWVDGNVQETGMTTAWAPNKQILGQNGEGDLDLQGTPLFRGGVNATFAAITSRSYHPGGRQRGPGRRQRPVHQVLDRWTDMASPGNDLRRRDHRRRPVLIGPFQDRDQIVILTGKAVSHGPRTSGGPFLSRRARMAARPIVPALRDDDDAVGETLPCPRITPNASSPSGKPTGKQNKTFRALDLDRTRPKLYVLDMFPYPSAAGLHVGHPEGYTATDILCRYKRMRGFNVLHPMGWDAFGLPAEQYAVQTNTHPRITTQANIDTFRRQIKSLGFSYDWDREVDTTDPNYYKWTQWIFLKLHDTWYDPEFAWTDAQGRERIGKGRPIAELTIPEGVADADAYRDGKRLAYRALVARELVPGAGDGSGQRRSHRRQERARRVPRRPDAA